MEGLIVGLVIGMFITYSFIYPETVKMFLGKVVKQIKKMY
jgi:hypothetical protein